MICNLFFVYTLLLNDSRYYVGYTANPSKRIFSHDKGNSAGSVYVRKYKIIAIHKIVPIKVENIWEAQVYENVITLFYGSKYGYNKVRGGNFIAADDEQNIKTIELARKKRTIALNKKYYCIDRLDIINDFNNKQNLFDIKNINLGTGETEHQ